jgi:hypothetical protein
VSVTTDFLTGIAVMINAQVPAISWTPSGTYTSTQTGIFMKLMPPTPDRALTLTAVNQGDNITLPFGQIMLQARFRGAANLPLDADDLGDSVFAILHGATNLTFGSMHVVQINRYVTVPNGMDSAQRWERIDQYRADIDFPPTTLRPTNGSW